MRTEISYESIKAMPPVMASVFTMDKAVLFATLVYVVLQVSYLLWKWRKEYKEGKKKV